MISSVSKILTVSLFLLLAGCNNNIKVPDQETIQSHGIIPLPVTADYLPGTLVIDSATVVTGDEGLSAAIGVARETLSNSLLNRTGNDSDTSGKKIIRFVFSHTMGEEGYEINISGNGIKLAAKTAAGAFYAAQTFRQMIWAITSGKKQPSFEMHQMKIVDEPKYTWRGFHIDISRHCFTKEFILRTIDELAYYKINRLHLHLTDDQGWRIESAQYPDLTGIGGWRPFNEMDSACMAKAATDSKYIIDERFIKYTDGKTLYGGYFTREDIRDIIDYAGEKYIEIVPEIDMPGHMSAAINSYPFLSCTGTTGWGREFSYPICPCKAEVITFCHNVWDEIAALFPSKFVHIGCDEVDMKTWESSPACMSFMSENNIKSVKDIQSFFVSDLQNYLERKGKTVIVWDDVIDGKADRNLVMMYWRDWVKDSPARCAAGGNSIILTPWSPFYISGDHTDKTLKDLYDYDPSAEFPSQVTGKIMGLQSCLWTEEIPSEAMFEYLVYPRMQALSEVEWGAGKDWGTFQIRLGYHLKYMTARNIKYRKPSWAN